MKPSVFAVLARYLFAGAVLTGCAGGTDDAPHSAAPPAPDAERSARTLPLPSASPERGHADPGGTLATRLEWDAPEGWIDEPPAMRMRFAQYRIPGPAGDAECVVFYFGPGQGGDAMSNIARWAGQFTQPDGSDSRDRLKTNHLATTVPVVLAELTGTYDGGMSMTETPATPLPDAMLLAGIASGPDAPWFFKLTGPEATVREQRAAFEKMLSSLRPAP